MGLASDVSRDVGAMFNRQIPRTYGAINGMSESAKVLEKNAVGMAHQAATLKNAMYPDLKDLYTRMKQTTLDGSSEQALRVASAMKRAGIDYAGYGALGKGAVVGQTWGEKLQIALSAADGSGNYDKTRLALAAVGGVLGTAAVARVGMNAVDGDY